MKGEEDMAAKKAALLEKRLRREKETQQKKQQQELEQEQKKEAERCVFAASRGIRTNSRSRLVFFSTFVFNPSVLTCSCAE